jgi:biotin transporter BioY
METKLLKIDNILNIENKVFSLMKDLALIIGFAFLIGVSAKISIGIGMVPITMQTFVVLLSGILLGSKKGALSQLMYLFVGIVGIPLFARGGGIAYIMSPTFGYIIGFVLSAFVIGWLCEKGFNKKTAFLTIFIGNAVLYVPGLIWLSNFVGIEKVLLVGLYPFIIGDLLKMGLLIPIINKTK